MQYRDVAIHTHASVFGNDELVIASNKTPSLERRDKHQVYPSMPGGFSNASCTRA